MDKNSSVDRRQFLQGSAGLLALAPAVVGAAGSAAPGSVMATAAAGGNNVASSGKPKPYQRIPVEECFNIPEIANEQMKLGVGKHSIQMPSENRRQLFASLLEVEQGRLRDMDDAGVTMAILSVNAPGVQNLPDKDQATSLAHLANDRLAELMRKYPTRYGGLMSVAPQEPVAAAREIDRGMSQLGMNGVIINSHTNDEYLDDPKFTPIFEALTAHNAPLYLHPRDPSNHMSAAQDTPGFNIGWGYAAETGTHVIRMIMSGLFDRYPNLQLVIGHGGEGLPYFTERMDNRYAFEFALTGAKGLQRKPSEYLRQNLHYTTSGMNYWNQVRMMIAEVGIDRVMFAADYPMEVMRPAVDAMDAAPFSAADRAKFYHGNAEKLFRLKA